MCITPLEYSTQGDKLYRAPIYGTAVGVGAYMLELYRNACARPFQLATTPGFQVNTLRGALYDTWYYTILLHAKPPPCLAFWKVVQCATSIVRTYIPTGTHRFCGIRCLTRDILSSTLSVSPPPVVASVDDHLRLHRSSETCLLYTPPSPRAS